MKKIIVDANPLSDAWSAEWHAKRNAAVASLVDDGKAGRLWTRRDESLERDESDDEQIKWFFWRHHKPEAGRSRSDLDASPDAYLYEGLVACMQAARDDERKRLSAKVSVMLRAFLGDDFMSVMYDIAVENDINIGYD